MHPSQQSNPNAVTQPSGTSGGVGSGSSASSSSSGGHFKFIKDLEPNQKNINLLVIVLDVAKPTQTKDGHEVRSVRIADKTGSINLSVWNEYGAVLKEGDILRLNGCFTQIWKVSLQVKVSTKGQIVKIGEFLMVFNELPDMSILPPEILKEIQEQNKLNPNSPAGTSGGGPPAIQNQSKQNPPLVK
jgi:hypothetical protein